MDFGASVRSSQNANSDPWRMSEPAAKEKAEGIVKETDDPNFYLNETLREVFAGFVGVTITYVFINFIFKNVAGGALVLFSLVASIWCYLDRHYTVYALHAILQLVVVITVSVAISTPFPGFNLYYDNADLRRISIAHIPLAVAFSLLSGYLSYVEYLYPSIKETLKFDS
eukprot:Trichotokara_eunicae@DN3968_c0_g1_i3.p1